MAPHRVERENRLRDERGTGGARHRVLPPLLALQRAAGNAAVARAVLQRVGLQRVGPPTVTAVTPAAAEVGVGRDLGVRATVTGSSAPLTWALAGAPPGVTIHPSGKRAQVRTPAPVAGAAIGGANFTVTCSVGGAAPVVSTPVLLVEVTGVAFTPAPAFGASFATAIGNAVPPAATADPNRDGVTGNTATAAVTTAPAGRAVALTTPGRPGAAVAGTVVHPRAGTGTQRVRVTDTATRTFTEAPLTINSVPTRVSGFGAQTTAMPGQYGGWNTVLFGASDPSGAGSRPIAEIITQVRDDFAFGAPMAGAGAPSLAFSAPADNWTDQNTTPTTIDVNAFEGPGVPHPPRLILYRQQFFWMSWTGTFATTASATGTHRRTLLRSGGGHVFRTEQFFPGAAAPPMNDPYAGPPLVVLSGVTAAPVAADGVSTTNATVATTVPGRQVDWSVLSGGGSAAITAGAAANPVGSPAVLTATTTAGRVRLRVADTAFPHRRADGVVRVLPVALRGMTAPRSVAAGVGVATVSVTASPAGRVVDFVADNGAVVGPPAVAGNVHTATVTPPVGFTGVVTVTANDHVLPARTATRRIRFR
ncbi:hypothetical protein [Saccharothrix sp. Mg75]|uniref:hypothetical protein n=1 Tax=Saccharothrix sp. Mg75 TaxID=3445357 RepID=UPI003EEFF5FF